MGRTRVATVSPDALARPVTPAQPLAVTVLREHQVVLTIATTYIAVGGAVLLSLGQPWPIRVTTLPFVAIWLAGTACWLLAAFLGSPRRLRACFKPDRVLGSAIVALLAVPVQITFQSLKQAIGAVIGFPWDSRLDRWDRFIHGGPAWHLLNGFVVHRAALRTIDALYVLWFAEILVVLIWVSWTPNRPIRQRALLALLLLWIAAGTIGAALTASAGPCYVSIPGYQELLSRLDAYSPPLFARINQQGIWVLHEDGVWGPLAGISAMPSMHVAFATVAACIAWSRVRWLGITAWIYAIAIQVGSVVLAWHYAIDGYAGAACGWGCWLMAGRLAEINERGLIERDSSRQ